MTPGRNDPCVCGSGKKYKKCCGHAVGAAAVPAAPVTDAEVDRLAALMGAGRYAELEHAARQMLSRSPQAGVAWKALGIGLWMQGKEAQEALEQASRLLPRDAQVQSDLGTVLRKQEQYTEAERWFRRALAIEPRFAEAHNNLGGALQDQGRIEEAIASYRRALALKPEFALAHVNLGDALRLAGRFEEAVPQYSRALALEPALLEAHLSLGSCLGELRRFDESATCYRHALALQNDHVPARAALAEVMLDLGMADAVVPLCRETIDLAPQHPAAHVSLGMALRLLGRMDEAEMSCRRALEVAPEHAPALNFLAHLAAERGHFAEAETLFRRAIALEPKAVEAWAGIAGLRRMSAADADWAATVQRLADEPLAPRREAVLRYALGKYYDDVGEFDRAFAQYQRANDITSRLGRKFDVEASRRDARRVIAYYDAGWLRRVRGLGDDSARPVFIVGLPRSGTTLAEQIVAAHPDAFGAGELTSWVSAATRLVQETPGDAALGAILGELAGDHLRRLRELSAGAARVVDKQPMNFMSLGLIHAALPNARVIHMRRHPVDTCLSIYFQDFHEAHAYKSNLENLVEYQRNYERYMAHWRAILPAETLLEVDYEDLVEEQERWSRAMIEFVGLPWDPVCLEFQNRARAIITFSKWQARQKISKSSVARWRNYERHLGPLRALLEGVG